MWVKVLTYSHIYPQSQFHSVTPIARQLLFFIHLAESQKQLITDTSTHIPVMRHRSLIILSAQRPLRVGSGPSGLYHPNGRFRVHTGRSPSTF